MDPGFDASVISEFRTRLIARAAESLLFDTVLTYNVHITETCEDDLPHLITNVDTTIGPEGDGAATHRIHAALEQRGVLPATHIVVFNTGAPSLSSSRTRSPCRHRRLSPSSTHVSI